MSKLPNSADPPKLVEWVLSLILRDEIWNTPLGDFEEVYRLKAKELGVFRANLWYWREIFRLLPEKILIHVLEITNV